MEQRQNAFFKNRIMTAGPTPVPDFVLAAMSNSVYYHRSPPFAAVMQDCRKLLPPVFGTKEEVLIFGGTGTLAMEGAIANFFNAGDEVINVNAGKFGERWGQQAKVYGCKVHEIKVTRGEAVKVADVEKLLNENPNVRGVLVHASETSTGVRHDIKSIAKLCHKQKDCLMMVDAVTALGVFKVAMDDWGLDVVVGGSQKGFMLPPGLSFGAASPRAWARTQTIQNVRYYMDWRKEKKALLENTGAFTSAVTLIGGLREALKHFHEVGLENIYHRGWKLAAATRAAGRAMGFEPLVKNDNEASSACTSLIAEGSYTGEIRKRYGMILSGGQDELKGKIVRIGHIGYIDGWDVASQLMALGRTGQQLGKKVDINAGLDAFWKIADSSEDFTPADLR